MIIAAKNKYEYWLTDEGLTLLHGWAKDGLTDDEIASRVQISRKTLSDWKTRHPKIGDALKKGKEIVDYEVERSLYKKSVGYSVKEVQAFKCKNVYYDDGGHRCEKDVVVTAEIEKHIPADTTAIAIWLNNRKPDKWRRNAGKEKLDREKLEHEKNIDSKRYF